MFFVCARTDDNSQSDSEQTTESLLYLVDSRGLLNNESNYSSGWSRRHVVPVTSSQL